MLLTGFLVVVLFVAAAVPVSVRQTPDISGIWVATKDAPRLCHGDSKTTDSAAVVASVADRATGTIGQVAWLAGTWIGTLKETTVEERWTPPSGGSMLSIGRTMRNGVMGSFEFLCIVERAGGLVYSAMPNGRSPATHFTATSITPDSVTFENPAHDFPKMVRYTRRPDGSLETAVSGARGQRTETVVLHKQQ